AKSTNNAICIIGKNRCWKKLPLQLNPILLSLALDRRRVGVLHLEPIGRAAGTVGRAFALRHDAFKSHLAGMREHGRAVAFDMLVEPDAGAGLGYDRGERGLAHFQRSTPQVVTIQLDQVKGVEEYALVRAVVTDELERGNAVVVAGNSFAVDDA